MSEVRKVESNVISIPYLPSAWGHFSLALHCLAHVLTSDEQEDTHQGFLGLGAFLKMDPTQYISLFLLPEWVSVPGARPFLDEGRTKPQMGIGGGEGSGHRLSCT